MINYEITYYQNTPAAERRPGTLDDLECDWIVTNFNANSDLDAWKEAFEQVTGDSYDDWLDKYALETDFINYFDEKDWGDGSPILIRLKSTSKILYDTGYTKESWADEFIEADESDEYDDEFDGDWI